MRAEAYSASVGLAGKDEYGRGRESESNRSTGEEPGLRHNSEYLELPEVPMCIART